MTTTIQTLQERLEDRAREEARKMAQVAVDKLPRFSAGARVTLHKGALGPDKHEADVTIWVDNLRHELRRFYEDQFYQLRLEELTKALVEDIVLRNEDE